MKHFNTLLLIVLVIASGLLSSCSSLVEDDYADEDLFTDSGLIKPAANLIDTAPLISATAAMIESRSDADEIDTKDLSPKRLVDFAHTLIGTPYKYASTEPDKGFDCSGFITYVFNHFDVAVPRSSRDFVDVGKSVSKKQARQGDLILFTGTDPRDDSVGHMGIVTFSTPDTLLFIHSTSGKMNGVTVTPLNDYYQTRFVKIVRIFPENYKASTKG